ncbi:MAG: tRNA threonylcarbamoyladenosine biosynthesis protein TsaE [Alphaproteobacteria bacterium MarineAlpha11_Bin1]|nr:MAG: tRNA threonylcarbamoyladenosine biosynthesis protein TsaE [Alphaproteobacteria bacterium MarineAlpha11_Bin1]|tara:strand:- start:11440 stop:11904 length:465 start_codon:yes stop_codon:yes gene_type:complete
MVGVGKYTRMRSVTLPDQRATEALAAEFASALRRGTVIALTGDLGMGKTVFARALIQARSKAAGIEVGAVPSPTFTLLQQYDLPDFSIYHFDLYRLSEPEEVWEIGLEEAFAEGVALIEWADRIEAYLPAGAIVVHLTSGLSEEARIAEISESK